MFWNNEGQMPTQMSQELHAGPSTVSFAKIALHSQAD
jgi:hypothetical protein